MITRPDVNGNADESAGGHAGVVAGTAPQANRFERRRTPGLSRPELIRDGRAQIFGPVCQEVLSGIREQERFRRIRDELRAFDEPLLQPEDYEDAARMTNQCRGQGIAGSAIDFLICAVAHRRSWEIFTTDNDFRHYARILPVKLYAPA